MSRDLDRLRLHARRRRRRSALTPEGWLVLAVPALVVVSILVALVVSR